MSIQDSALDRKSFLKAIALAGIGVLVPWPLKAASAKSPQAAGGNPRPGKPLIGDHGYDKMIGDLFAQAPARRY